MKAELLLWATLVSYGTTTALHSAGPTPVVIWHGMGDTCCNPASMGSIMKIIEDNVPGIYMYSVRIGNTAVGDVEHGFLGNANKQVAEVCETIAKDPQLQGGYNAIGFSQGGQFLRAVAQRCPNPPMKNLVSIGGQHQAQYWHDPLDFETYVDRSIFIAEINNEKPVKNESYAVNLANLQNLVLVKHNLDTMVEPKESEHFEFYRAGQAEEIVPLRESLIYTEDRIGLKALDESGRLQFLELESDHLDFSTNWFIQNIVNPYFKNLTV